MRGEGHGMSSFKMWLTSWASLLPPRVAATLCAVWHPLTLSGWRWWRWAGAGFLPSVSCCFLWLILSLAISSNMTGNRKIPCLLFKKNSFSPFSLEMLFVCFSEADGSENARNYWVFHNFSLQGTNELSPRTFPFQFNRCLGGWMRTGEWSQGDVYSSLMAELSAFLNCRYFQCQ